MKIVNYRYGYVPQFNCSIHGKIIVTLKEWKKIREYLLKPAVLKKIPFSKATLEQDLWTWVKAKNGYLCNIRVTPTKLVVEHFKTTGRQYKEGNYMFLITDNPKNSRTIR